jgi:glycosyltransferase involved in cell wall biosynthesis
MRMARAARDEARRLFLLDRQAHFVPEWVDYARRGDYLLDADAVVSAGPAGLEHHFAYRTRLLDAVWAGRPVIATEGEVVAQRLAQAGAALLVPPGDAPGMASAMKRLAADRTEARRMGRRAAGLAESWRWPRVLEGLVRACLEGTRVHAPRGGERRWYRREHFKLKQLDRLSRWRAGLERRLRGGT